MAELTAMAKVGAHGLAPALAAAMLAALCGCHRESPSAPTAAQPPPPGAARVDAERLAAGEPDQWLTPGRDANGTYYSPLRDINAGNVGKLGFAWDYRLGTSRGQESTPLVIDGVMYATSNFGRVYALDAASGKELWKYDPHIDGQWARYACCDAVNRGLVAFDGRLYVGALDGWLHALDARTGQLVWKVDTLIGRSEHKPYTLTGAPLLAGDLIIVGNAGADFAGARGYVAAYDLKSGAFRWRFFTVPRNPAEGPQDQPHLEAAVKTWDPRHRWDAGSGGTVWDGMAYDPALGSCTSAPPMRRPTTCISADARAAMSSTRHRSSRSMRTMGRWPGTTRPPREIDGTSTARRRSFWRTSISTGGAASGDAGRQEWLLLRARPRHRRAAVGE